MTVYLNFIATASLPAQNNQKTPDERLFYYLESRFDYLPQRLQIHYIYPFDCVSCLATMKNRISNEKHEDTGHFRSIILFRGDSNERRIKAVLKYLEVNNDSTRIVLRDDSLSQMVKSLRPPGIKVSHSIILDIEKRKIVKSY